MEPKITETSKALFIEYAEDAGNWSGAPLVDGNVEGTKERRGNLTQLKRAGLIQTVKNAGESETWLYFTERGQAFAAANGVDLSWINAIYTPKQETK